MVSVVVAAPSVALVGLLRVRIIVSLLSGALSLIIGMLAVRVATPGAKVSVPLVVV